MDLGVALAHAVAVLEPGGRLVAVHELTGGVSATVRGLELVTTSGQRRRVVFRQHRSPDFKGHAGGVAAKEHAVLVALHGEGLAVPEPFLLDDCGTTAPFLVMAWVDGSTEVAEHDLPSALDQMAAFLARLHALGPGAIDGPGLDPLEDPRSALVPFLPPTEAGDRVRAALAAGTPAGPNNAPALLHGDYWPGNVMWRHGRLVAVIDWEDACVGDPLADLATARVELLCRYGAGAMERFTACYLALVDQQAGRLRLESLPLWEAYVSAAALATMGAWGLEPAEEAHRRRLTGQCFDRAAGQLAGLGQAPT